MNRKWFILAPLAFLLFITLGGFVVMYLWNWLLPPLFSWPQINFWQALGLLALSRILFGGFGFHGRRWRRPWMHRGMEDMTPEERQRFEQWMHEHPHAEEKA